MKAVSETFAELEPMSIRKRLNSISPGFLNFQFSNKGIGYLHRLWLIRPPENSIVTIPVHAIFEHLIPLPWKK